MSRTYPGTSSTALLLSRASHNNWMLLVMP